MKPSTFSSIKNEAMSRGLTEERATKEAGKAYWASAKAKYKQSKGGK